MTCAENRAQGAMSPAGGLAMTCFDLGAGITAGFTSREGGVSAAPYASLNLGQGVGDDPAAVAANRARLAAACGLQPADLAWMHQVHGSDVCYLGSGTPQPPHPVDSIMTDVPDRALCVLVADCVPVLIADPEAGLIGAAHAGREGMVAGVVPALVGAMAAAGGVTGRMRAVTGPGICGRCYEVPAELQARVAAAVPAARCLTSAGTPGLDITAGVRAQLEAAGVGSAMSAGQCTRESPALFSYRRDGTTGRFAGVIWRSR